MRNPVAVEGSASRQDGLRIRFALPLGFHVGLIVLGCLAGAPCALASPGYEARPCGFDLDRNGVIGEAADCRICNGQEADPDGDGVDEDLIYVDADAGSDETGDGSPAHPYRTIAHGFTQADGPADGAEDIVCFRGISTESSLDFAAGGVAGTFVVPASGSRERDWLYPSNPARLVGWDSDGDGEYPPFDNDDTAVLDGAGGAARAFDLRGGEDFLEIAHLAVRAYGRDTEEEDTGFIRFGPTGGNTDFLWLHDIELSEVNRGRPAWSTTSAINLFTGGVRLHWLVFENMRFADNGAWFTRGAGPNGGADVGPLRWQNVSLSVLGCPEAVCGSRGYSTAFKVWGYLSGVEILDSVWEARPHLWDPIATGGQPGASFVVPAQCTRDWLVRGNIVRDYKHAFAMQGYSEGFCDGEGIARPVDDILIDGNLVHNDYALWRNHLFGVSLDRGLNLASTVANVTVTNNVFSASTPMDSCIWIRLGNDEGPNPGTVTIAHNTCSAAMRSFPAIAVGHSDASLFPAGTLKLLNNLITGLSPGNVAVGTTYAPALWTAAGNVYDPAASFAWNGAAVAGLEEWRSISGGDASSRSCIPQFADAGGQNGRLAAADTCARDAGVDLPAVAHDVDGDSRPVDQGWDAGADESCGAANSDPFCVLPTVARCGNGIVEDGENCDDGNTNAGDCCPADCVRSHACAEASASRIAIRRSAKPGRDRLVWTWRAGPAVDVASIGSPTLDAGFRICVSDAREAIRAEAPGSPLVVPAGGGWSGGGVGKWKYRSRDGEPSGVTALRVGAGEAGKGRLRVIAKGSRFGPLVPASESAMFAMDPDVLIEAVSDAGGCWSARFATAAGNNSVRFSSSYVSKF